MNTKFKFGLTLAATLVLAACGSSGNKGGNTAENKPVVNPTPVETTPAQPKPDVPMLAQDNGIAYGAKLAKKSESDFRVPGTNGKNDSSDKPTFMTVKLNPELDTVVVAAETDKEGIELEGGQLVYLDGFKFTKDYSATTAGAPDLVDAASFDSATSTGRFDLTNVYKATAAGDKVDVTTAKTATATATTATATALVYIENNLTAPGNDKADAMYINRSEKFKAGSGNSVAEVYGHRTFAHAGSVAATGGLKKAVTDKDFVVDAKGNLKVNNLPLVKAQLNEVQYGRVTSALNGLKKEDLKEGAILDQTRIAAYADYGFKGTEDSYFYRGINSTSEAAKKTGADLVTHLKEHYKSGKIKYEGHAVTYGFKNEYLAPEKVESGIPNAILAGSTAKPVAVSGTHVSAEVDLNTYHVKGSLYNIFEMPGVIGADAKKGSEVATFDGTLTTHGNVVGTSRNLEKDADGSFRATLFGTTAQELGGAISSNNTEDQHSWGAVFGATQAKDSKVNGLGIGTDSDNRGK